MGVLLQVMTRAQLRHWLPVAIVAVAAVVAFATAFGLSLYLPVELE